MTKLELNLSNKKSEEGKTAAPETATDVENPDAAAAVPIIAVGEMDLGPATAKTGGGAGGPTGGAVPATAGCREIWADTFNWKAIRRVATTQMAFSTVAMLCIVISIFSTGMASYKFSQFIMTMYLLITGHSGLRASAKSYKHLIFYLIMSALQWMINIMVLGCLTYAMYDVPYYNYGMRQTMRTAEYDDLTTGVTMLVIELVGSLAMMGTIVTGMLGLTACCKGFGNLLMNQEKYFQMNRNAMNQV